MADVVLVPAPTPPLLAPFRCGSVVYKHFDGEGGATNWWRGVVVGHGPLRACPYHDAYDANNIDMTEYYDVRFADVGSYEYTEEELHASNSAHAVPEACRACTSNAAKPKPVPMPAVDHNDSKFRICQQAIRAGLARRSVGALRHMRLRRQAAASEAGTLDDSIMPWERDRSQRGPFPDGQGSLHH